mmetsp:Transcript_46348/g.97375  ORF Transcript_46348/g.97375 Transcript_46348/m.97375 type:complete len:658 (-) Transcript_46348:353-2326(-)
MADKVPRKRWQVIALAAIIAAAETKAATGETCDPDVTAWYEHSRDHGWAFTGRNGGCATLPNYFESDAKWVEGDKTFTPEELATYCDGDRLYAYSQGAQREQMHCKGCGDDSENIYAGSYGRTSWVRDDRLGGIEDASGFRMGTVACNGKISSMHHFVADDDAKIETVQKELAKAVNTRNCDGFPDLFDQNAVVKSNSGTYEGPDGIKEWCESVSLTAATTRGNYYESNSGLRAFFFHLYAGPDTFIQDDYTGDDLNHFYIDNAAILSFNDGGKITELKHTSNVDELPTGTATCLSTSEDADEGVEISVGLEDFNMEPYFAGWKIHNQGLTTFPFSAETILREFVDTPGCYFYGKSPLFVNITKDYECTSLNEAHEVTGQDFSVATGVPIEGPRWFTTLSDSWGETGITAYIENIKNVIVNTSQAPFITQGHACLGCGDGGEDWAVAQFHSSNHKPHHFTMLDESTGLFQQIHTYVSEQPTFLFPFMNEFETKPVRDAMVHAINSRDCDAFRDLFTDTGTAITSGGNYDGDEIKEFCKTMLFPTTSPFHFSEHGTHPNSFAFTLSQYHPDTPIEIVVKFTTDGNIEGGAIPKIVTSMWFHSVGLGAITPQECICCSVAADPTDPPADGEDPESAATMAALPLLASGVYLLLVSSLWL